MSDIFISYARTDRDRAQALAGALEQQGYSVWWDPHIPPGKTFDEVIEEALDNTKCVVVLWSKDSVKSDWVKTEAEEGKQRKILVPALIDKVKIPLAFRRIHAADLTKWQPNTPHSEFDSLLKAISEIVGPPPAKETETASVEASAAEQDRVESDSMRTDKELPTPTEVDSARPTPQPSETTSKTPTGVLSIKKEPPSTAADDSEIPKVEPPGSSVEPAPDETKRTERVPGTPGPGTKRFSGAAVGIGVAALILIVLVLYNVFEPKSPERIVVPPSKSEPAPSKPSQPEPSAPKTLTNSIGMKFVLIPAGTFTMGSPIDEPGRDNDETQHVVTIAKPFYMQTTEVTVGQWRIFVYKTGYRSEAETDGGVYVWAVSKMGKKTGTFWDNPGFAQADSHPVSCVSWNDAQAFIKWLNEKREGIYRLPTEAEWEYACRAGTRTRYYTGNSEADLNRAGWYADNSNDRTHPVGGKDPNSHGLYDIHGNVWEWCADWYADYLQGVVPDPQGPPKGSARVFRGGCWLNDASNCRSARRNSYPPGYRFLSLGFRLARSVAP